ncbi:unnamed protein product [Ambrosiozyma monospora]|uniref:Unnamed protein product n=1 Tax=Ambrosiozyma monospora TaxID=43982 RepID=A0ACB5SZF4_AMBMO|nr:unnamed protein product [Ambrosiozyma monospora]
MAKTIPDQPPSYDEVIQEEGLNTPNNSSAPSLPSRRTDVENSGNVPHHPDFLNEHNKPARDPKDLYTSNLALPWRYPKGYFCKKCKNTGYKTKSGGEKKYCKDCWRKFKPYVTVIPPYPGNGRLVESKPVRYSSPVTVSPPVKVYQPIVPPPLNPNVVALPPGTSVYHYYPPVPMVPAPPPMPYNATGGSRSSEKSGSPMSYQPAPPPPPPPPPIPLVVQPGDPRIGGMLCPRCQGRGQVHFFLDLEKCTVCNGLGRVGSNQMPLY